MNHAAAGNFHPLLAHPAGQVAGEIDFKTGLGVAEVMRTEADLHVAAQEILKDELHRPLEIADGDPFVHVKSLDLLEGRVVGRVGVDKWVTVGDLKGTVQFEGLYVDK